MLLVTTFGFVKFGLVCLFFLWAALTDGNIFCKNPKNPKNPKQK